MIEKIKFENKIFDNEQLWKLFLTTGWNDDFQLTKEELISAISNSWYVVSAVSENKLVGFGRVVSDGILHAMIYEMIIDPDYQLKGIGAEILKRLLLKCNENNIRDVQLFCAKGKKLFYEKYGFVSRPDDAPGMDYMMKLFK